MRIILHMFVVVNWGDSPNPLLLVEEFDKVCVVPMLFCLYINGLIDSLKTINNNDAPRLVSCKVPALMFADDTLLSKTPMGFQRTLDSFNAFCKARGLEINVPKTKIMVFNPSHSTRQNPSLNGILLELRGFLLSII